MFDVEVRPDVRADAANDARRPSRDLSLRPYFGGPGQANGVLRDLLQARIEATPSGGAIDWMTYYFRDERLADALAGARRRGVKVRVCVEGWPRRRRANDNVIRRLGDSAAGVGAGLRVVRRVIPSHLHAKVYAFSHPAPHVLVGSFNPSGCADPDAAKVTADIGDHDRGHNLLVEVRDPAIVDALVRRVRALHSGAGVMELMRARCGDVAAGEHESVFFPRLGRNPLDLRLQELGPAADLRIAVSHLRDPWLCARLCDLARAGAEVQVLTHDTLRRTPRRVERALAAAGVTVWRYRHPEGLPMHCKFVLVRESGRRWAGFGSYNFTLTSRWLNQELLVFSESRGLWDALDARWGQIRAERWTKPCQAPSGRYATSRRPVASQGR
jgi:phosphatidylserine/phosphatidylglycerophosphate/cardiolipin synthase-like enzyme